MNQSENNTLYIKSTMCTVCKREEGKCDRIQYLLPVAGVSNVIQLR
jgi:hypothetical protein